MGLAFYFSFLDFVVCSAFFNVVSYPCHESA